MNKPPMIVPDDASIPENGELMLATRGGVVYMATKRGGLIVGAEPQWIKVNVWTFMTIIGQFLEKYSQAQIATIQQMLPIKPN